MRTSAPQVWRVEVPERLDKKLGRLDLSIVNDRFGNNSGQQPPLSFQTATDRDLNSFDKKDLKLALLTLLWVTNHGR
jgi:hypothetical protein